jgi:hypothetical protein
MEDIVRARAASRYSAPTIASSTSASETTGSSSTTAVFVSVTDSCTPEGLQPGVNVVDLTEDAPAVAAPIALVKKVRRK